MNIAEITVQLQELVLLVKINLPIVLSILGLLWGLHIFNFLIGYRLNLLGIFPRSVHGLLGILTSPFLHGNFNHLFFNSIPLFVLMNFMLMSGINHFMCSSIIIIFLSGLGVWLFGRKAIHIGASSVIMGYWGIVLLSAYENPSVITIIFVFVSLYYFGGLLFSILPSKEAMSWEGHLFGLLGGIASVYLCPWMGM